MAKAKTRSKHKSNEWQLTEAKAHLSEVVRRARSEGPQRITCHGRDAVIVMAEKDAPHPVHSKYKTLGELLRDSPLVGSGINLEREQDYGRDIDL